MDLRGHGGSDKPLEPEQYAAPELWTTDIDAVIHAMELENPALVGWSMAGSIIADYVHRYGDEDIGALAFVGAFTSRETAEGQGVIHDEALTQFRGMASHDPRTNITSTRTFVDMLTADDLDRERFATIFGSSMMVPPEVRGAILGRERQDSYAALADVQTPALVVHGTEDQIVRLEASEYTA